MGQLFWLSPKLRDFRGIFEKYAFFEEKSLKMGALLAKITLKDGYGLRGSSGTPLSNSNLSTPLDPGHQMRVIMDTVHSNTKNANARVVNLNFKCVDTHSPFLCPNTSNHITPHTSLHSCPIVPHGLDTESV